MLRYLMIVGIVVLHTPPYVPVAEMGPGLFDFIKAFFQSAMFRATVPVLTVISGYLLFQSGLDQHWMRLAKKKTRTIIARMSAWMTIFIVSRQPLSPALLALVVKLMLSRLRCIRPLEATLSSVPSVPV